MVKSLFVEQLTRIRSLSPGTVFYGIVLCVFFFSGAAGLIYQVTWQRLLTLHYGLGAVSVAIVVAVFLAGLGIGALVGGWVSERVRHRLVLYLLIEVFIGLFAVVSLDLFAKVLPALATMTVSSGFLLITLVLLVPTVLMGMTLPLVVKILNEIGKDPGHTLSLLYFVNTIGAAFGALVAAYGLISFLGISGAIYVAAGINFLLALLVGLALRPYRTWRAGSAKELKPVELSGIGFQEPWMTYGAVFFTGFLAIGYQLIWFRINSTILKPSPYVFSTVLAIYLLGIAIGSYWMSRRIKSLHADRSHKEMFCRLNAGIALLTLLTLAVLYHGGDVHPLDWMIRTSFDEELHPPYHPMYAITGKTWAQYLTSVYLAFDILLWPILTLLPATILMGASFPLIAAMSIEADQREGWISGLVYAVTIVGNVLGALVTGFVMLPWFGSEITLIAFTIVGLLWILGIQTIGGRHPSILQRGLGVAVLAAGTVVVLPGQGDLYRLFHPSRQADKQIVTEHVDGVVVTYHSRVEDQDRASVYIGGSAHASYPHAAYRTEVLEAITYAPSVKDNLVIGFGGGDLTGTLLQTQGVENVTVVEISNALIENVRQIPFYYDILGDKRVNLIVEDGRRFLLTNPSRYDLVLMDPLRSTAAYSNNIYSREFFELLKTRLRPGGVLMIWMNEYIVIPKTLVTSFDYLRCYYFFCLASDREMSAHLDRREPLWKLYPAGIQKSVTDRMSRDYYYKGDRSKILDMTRSAPVNTDHNPITEYYVGYNLKRYFGSIN